MKSLTSLLFAIPLSVFAQVDMSIDTMFHRMGQNGNFQTGLDYYYLTDYFADSSFISAVVSNNGSSDATNVQIAVEFPTHLNSTDTYYSDPIDICSGCSDSLYIDPLLLYYFGSGSEKSIIFEVLSDSIELNPNNNSDSLMYYAETTTYTGTISRDNKVNSDSIPLSFNGVDFNNIGNIFEAYRDLRVVGTEVHISSDLTNEGEYIHAELWIRQDTTWHFLATSEDHLIDSWDLTSPIMLYFQDMCVNTGDVFMVTVAQYGTNPVYIKRAQNVDYGTVVGSIDATWKSQVNPKALMVRPEISHYPCGVGIDESIDELNLCIYPNPTTTGYVNISGISPNETVIYEITDLQGKILDQGNLTNSSLQLPIFQGVFFINIIYNNKAQTERIIVIQ